MKLFLTSSFDKVTDLFLQKVEFDVKGKRVLFVENASDPYAEEKWWVESDRSAFLSFGCEVVSLDLRTISIEDFEMQLKDAPIIHFCGGSVLYVIALLKEKCLDKILSRYVKEGKILYTGTSAGSMIVAKDLSLSKRNAEEAERVSKMTDFSGLSWVDFAVIPHSNSTDWIPENKKIVEALPGYGYPVIFLSDAQAIWVEDKKLEVLAGK